MAYRSIKETGIDMLFSKTEKGNYGYLKKLKNRRLILMIICFIFILGDVLFSLIFFQTKKTLFVIIAAVMSIPFAKNLIGYLMTIKYKPLTEAELKEAEAIAAKHETALAYDVSVTDTEGILYYPCVAIYNNNVIAMQQQGQNQKKKDSVAYLKKIRSDAKPRVVVVDSLKEIDRELSRLNPPREEQKREDLILAERLLELGL